MGILEKINSRPRPFAGIKHGYLAVLRWSLIQLDPTEIVIARLGYPQIVRISFARNVQQLGSFAGDTVSREAVIYGVTGHPDPDVRDTVMMANDTFTLAEDGTEYRIGDVMPVPGGVQAVARWSSV